MLKKGISSLLVICLVLLSMTNAFASSGNQTLPYIGESGKLIKSVSEIDNLANEKNLSSTTKNHIMSEIEILENMGLGCFDLSSIDILDGGCYLYTPISGCN